MARRKFYIKKEDGFYQVQIAKKIHSWGRPDEKIKGYTTTSGIIVPVKYVRNSSITGSDTEDGDLKISTFIIPDNVPDFYVISRREVWSKNKITFNLTSFHLGKKTTIKMETDMTIPESSMNPYQIMIEAVLNNFPNLLRGSIYRTLTSAKDIETCLNTKKYHPLLILGEQSVLMENVRSYIFNTNQVFAGFYMRKEND